MSTGQVGSWYSSSHIQQNQAEALWSSCPALEQVRVGSYSVISCLMKQAITLFRQGGRAESPPPHRISKPEHDLSAFGFTLTHSVSVAQDRASLVTARLNVVAQRGLASQHLALHLVESRASPLIAQWGRRRGWEAKLADILSPPLPRCYQGQKQRWASPHCSATKQWESVFCLLSLV